MMHSIFTTYTAIALAEHLDLLWDLLLAAGLLNPAK